MARAQITCEEIARQLGGGKEIKTGPSSWSTLCPVHGDKTPSLSLTDKGGKILIHCHAGCSNEDVIDELRRRDLWPRKYKTWVAKPHAPKGVEPPSGMVHPKLGKPTASWVYRNRQGLVAGAINRFVMLGKDNKPVFNDDGTPKKEIIPISWCYSDEGEMRWHWRQMAEPRCLYNEHRLGEEKPILLVEGEKSADKAQELVGDTYLVMTWPGGGKAVSRANWVQLKGRDVTIWPDNDVPGLKAAQVLAEILHTVGVTSVRKVDLPDGLSEGWDLADEIPPNVDVLRLIRQAPHYAPMGDSVVERFNAKFALVMVGGQAVVLHEDGITNDGRANLNYLSVAGFKEFYGNKTTFVGKQAVPESTYWLKHESRRSYNRVIFEPETVVDGAYNMWRGFSHEPDPAGDWSLLDEHIRENLAKGDESLYRWILAWFAHIVQSPNKKSGTSLAFRGKQGTGKTIIGKAMGALYRPHYVLVEDPRYVLGQFNSHMATTLLLHCDEGFFAGDPRNVGKLKGMVTSDTHRIELKGKDSFEVNNYMRLLITSNHDFVVPAAFEERRFAVFDAGEGRLQDRSFFNALWRQLNNGGFGGLLYHLQRVDLTNVDVDVGVIPQTNALQDQKLYSLDGVARFWFERLYYGQISTYTNGSGAWPDSVPIESLYQAYIKRSENWGERRRVDSCTFGKEMKKFWPGGQIDKRRVSVEKRDEGGVKHKELTWAYILKPLESHRGSFSTALGHNRWVDLESFMGGNTGENNAPPPDVGGGGEGDEDLPF